MQPKTSAGPPASPPTLPPASPPPSPAGLPASPPPSPAPPPASPPPSPAPPPASPPPSPAACASAWRTSNEITSPNCCTTKPRENASIIRISTIVVIYLKFILIPISETPRRDVPEKGSGGAYEYAPHGSKASYGKAPCLYIVQNCFHSCPNSRNRRSPPDMVGETKLGQIVSMTYDRGSSEGRKLPSPRSMRTVPSSRTTFPVCGSK